MARKVEVEITGRDELSGVLGGIKGTLTGLGNVALSVAAGGVAALGAGMAGLGVFIKGSVDSAMEAEGVLAQLDAVIASTGGAAGLTAEQVSGMASDLQKVTKFGDEAIISGQNMLLTFTNIGEDVFPQATEIMLDMSQALGQDLKGSAMQLGKALNDPIKGVSALSRVGVTFTKEQEDMIAKMVAVGDTAGAQKIILAELAREFGGSARAAGETFAGKLEILKNRFDEVKETVGVAVMPLLEEFLNSVVIPAAPYVEAFANALVGLAKQAGVVIDFFQAGGSISDFFATFEDGSNYIGGFMQALGMSEEKANAFGTAVGEAFAGLTSAAEPFVNFLSIMGQWWELNGPAIMGYASEMGGSLISTFQSIAADVRPLIETGLTKLSAWFVENGPLIQAVIKNMADTWTQVLMPAILVVWDTIRPILYGLIDVVLGIATFLMQIATGDWAGAWTSIQQVVVDAGTAIGEAIMNFLEGIAGFFDTSLAEIAQTWSDIFEQLPPIVAAVAGIVVDKVVDMGAAIVSGIRDGISAGWESLSGWFNDLVGGLLGSAMSVLGIHSPSTEFAFVGEQIMAGLSKGIGDGVSVPVRTMENSLAALTTATTVSGISAEMGVNAQSANAGGLSVVLQINSPVTVLDEKMAQETLMRYIENGVRELQAKGMV